MNANELNDVRTRLHGHRLPEFAHAETEVRVVAHFFIKLELLANRQKSIEEKKRSTFRLIRVKKIMKKERKEI